MKTFSSLQRDDKDNSDSSDDEGQAFYAGGSETRFAFDWPFNVMLCLTF